MKEDRIAASTRIPTFLMDRGEHEKMKDKEDKATSNINPNLNIGNQPAKKKETKLFKKDISKRTRKNEPTQNSLTRLKTAPSIEAFGPSELLPDAAVKKWTHFDDRLKNAFAKCGEAPTQSALMNLIYPYDFPQTDMYAKLQGKFRINELTDLVRRLINILTEESKMVFTIQEAQWMDPFSWELLWELAVSCPRVMVCLFSRPEKYHENEETRSLYIKFKRHPRTEVFSLDGLSLEETSKLIIHNWPSAIPPNSIHATIVENVQKRAGGNPLYIKSIVIALKESGHCRINDKGELRLLKDDFDFDKSVGLGGNLQSILVAQFDRLDPNFQLFLKVASVLGQTFHLEDVLYLLSDTPGFSELFSADSIEVSSLQIKALDKYNFLQMQENGSGDPEDEFLIQFKSSVVRRAVYTMMVVAQRQQLHLNIAIYYERVMDDSNKHRLLIPLYEHYAETDDKQILKRLYYLETVAHVLFEKNSMGEAIKHYCNLIELSEHASNLEESLAVHCDLITQSTWHRELGDAYFSKGDDVNSEKHLLKCLELLNHPFPKNSILLGWKVRAQSTKRNKYPIITTGSTLQTTSAQTRLEENNDDNTSENSADANVIVINKNPVGEAGLDPMAAELAIMLEDKSNLAMHTVRKALNTLAQIYLNTGHIQGHKYAVLKGVNISEGFPHDAIYARFLSMCGALSWFSEGKKKMSLRYLESASKHDPRMDLSQTVAIVLSTALTLFLMGKWGSSMRRLSALPFLEMMSGDCSMRAEALRMRSIVIHMSGARSQSIKAARDLFSIANQEGNWEGKVWGCELTLANLLTTSQNDAEIIEISSKLKLLWNQIPEKNKDDPILGINYLGFTAEVEFRYNSGFLPESFIKALQDYASDLRNLQSKNMHAKSAYASNAWGGGAASAGGPHHWLAMVGIVHCAAVILGIFDSGLVIDAVMKKRVEKICIDIEKWLTTGQIMKYMTLAHPIRYMYKGIRVLVRSKSAAAAVAAWKKALTCRRVSDLLYIRGILHLRIAKYATGNSESNHHAHEAQKLLRRIGASFDFETASALRKDRKKKEKLKKSKSGDDDGSDNSKSYVMESKSIVDRAMNDYGQSFDDRSEIN